MIYCPANALMHLPTWADRRRTFERVAASLRPGGRFAWNAFAFDHHLALRLDGQPQEQPVPHVNRYNIGDNRVDIILEGGERSSLWWATRNEWLGLLDVSGLQLEALYGGFAGSRSPRRAPCTSSSLAAEDQGTPTRAGWPAGAQRCWTSGRRSAKAAVAAASARGASSGGSSLFPSAASALRSIRWRVARRRAV